MIVWSGKILEATSQHRSRLAVSRRSTSLFVIATALQIDEMPVRQIASARWTVGLLMASFLVVDECA